MTIEEPTVWQRHSVILPVALTAADRLVTVPNFEYESNPIVTMLGIEAWLALTVITLAGMLIIWYAWDMHRSKVAQGCVLALGALMTLVVASNLYVLYG